MSQQDSCASCKFYDRGDSSCHVQPPKPGPLNHGENIEVSTNWPMVTPDDWCSKYEQGQYKDAPAAANTTDILDGGNFS